MTKWLFHFPREIGEFQLIGMMLARAEVVTRSARVSANFENVRRVIFPSNAERRMQ